jgi:hypothetical protein
MAQIKIYIPYAPISMNILDVYLFFQSQTGNHVNSVHESIHQDDRGKFKSFTIVAFAHIWNTIFTYMNHEQRIIRYIPYRNKYAKIRAWIQEV